MSVSWVKDKKRWRFHFVRVINGERYQATKLLPQGWSRAQADKYDREEVARLYATATGIQRDEPLIDDAVRLYLENVIPHQKDGHKAAQTLGLLYPDYTGRKLSDLATVAQEYRRGAMGLKPATVRNRLAYLRAACRYAFKEHKLGDHLPHLVTPKVSNQRHEFPTRKQTIQIMRACKNRESRAVIALAFYSGMRWQTEILPAKFDGESLSVPDTKNDRPHSVPLHPKAWVYARKLPLKLKPWSLYKYYKEAAKSVGLGHLTMHDQRHGTASTLINAGATLSEVGAFLGHTSPQATARYAHLTQDTKRKMMAKLVRAG